LLLYFELIASFLVLFSSSFDLRESASGSEVLFVF